MVSNFIQRFLKEYLVLQSIDTDIIIHIPFLYFAVNVCFVHMIWVKFPPFLVMQSLGFL